MRKILSIVAFATFLSGQSSPIQAHEDPSVLIWSMREIVPMTSFRIVRKFIGRNGKEHFEYVSPDPNIVNIYQQDPDDPYECIRVQILVPWKLVTFSSNGTYIPPDKDPVQPEPNPHCVSISGETPP